MATRKPSKRPSRTKAVANTPAPRRAVTDIRPQPHAAAAATSPILDASDLRKILSDVATQLAPGDLETLMAGEVELRARAASLPKQQLPLLREQVNLALDCLSDHLNGLCPQIPYYTVALLGAAVYYFNDELDVIPDFLPGVGRLDDAAVMAMACDLAHAGLRRYCDSKGISPSWLERRGGRAG